MFGTTGDSSVHKSNSAAVSKLRRCLQISVVWEKRWAQEEDCAMFCWDFNSYGVSWHYVHEWKKSSQELQQDATKQLCNREIILSEEHHAECRFSIPSCSPTLLVIGTQWFRRRRVEDETHVCLINSHAKGNRGHQDTNLLRRSLSLGILCLPIPCGLVFEGLPCRDELRQGISIQCFCKWSKHQRI